MKPKGPEKPMNTNHHPSETHRRSLIKAVTWRVVATTTTVLIVWFFTGEPLLATGVGVVEVIAKMLLYSAHERAWNRAIFGKKDAQAGSHDVVPITKFDEKGQSEEAVG